MSKNKDRINVADYMKVGQPVVMAKTGNRCGSVGVIVAASDSGFRVDWMLSSEGVPFDTSKQARYAAVAMAPKLLDVLDPVPQTGRGFAFIYPLEGIPDVKKMVEAHRKDAEMQSKAVQTNFFSDCRRTWRK